MMPNSRLLTASICIAALALVAGLHRSFAASFRGEVFYIAQGESCPLGWSSRSGSAALQAAFGPAAGYQHMDMCIGGF